MLANPNDPTFPLNRAAAYLKLGKNEDAERDCTTVLKSDTKNVKALFRRGQSRVALQQLTEAQTDFENALSLEPANQAVKGELKRVEQALKAQSAKVPKRTKAADVPFVSQPSSTTPRVSAAKSVPRRRRIPIEVVDPAAPSSAPQASASSSDLLTPVTSRLLSTTSTPKFKSPDQPILSQKSTPEIQSPPDRTSSPSSISFQAAKEVRATKTMGGIFRSNGQHTLFGNQTSSSDSPSPSPPKQAHPMPTATPPAVDGASSSAAAKIIRIRGTSSKPPETLYMFTRRFDAANTVKDSWQLITDIAPDALPALFQSSLNAAALGGMLATFRDALKAGLAAPEDVCAYLKALTRVPRFRTVLLFMDKGERAVAEETWALIKTTDVDPETRLAWSAP